MRDPFDANELKRLNQTPVERLLDWVEENFKKHDYGPARGRQVGYQLMSENEDLLFAFVQRFSNEDQQDIRKKLRIIEGQCRFLEHVLEMLEPGYETNSQVRERLDEQKRLRTEQRRIDRGI